MLSNFDLVQFRRGHEAFLDFMEKKGGEPFTSFDHPFFVDDETDYKHRIRDTGRRALQVDRWRRWTVGSGRILQAMKNATYGKVSGNLLEHKYGKRNSNGALYRVESKKAIAGLESELKEFLTGDPRPEYIGARFDRFADYLRQNSLGCNWPFLAYLLFLLRPQTYFPIRPTAFDRLLKFYSIPTVLGGHVGWSNYLVLLDLADRLRELLSMYGIADTIQVQSYMWVVSYLVKEPITATEPPVDLNQELMRRQRQAVERERIGLAGEEYVRRREIEKLLAAGRPRLAKRVALTSITNPNAGYDVKSFTPSGEELHIEVKTTSRSATLDVGFWLSATEHRKAQTDSHWTLYRVWDIDTGPFLNDLGNVVRSLPQGWRIDTDTWFVSRM